MAGAPKGNSNARKGTMWRDAIHKALTQDRSALERLAKRLISMAEEGDMTAMKEIGDRLDGKPMQSHEVGGPDGGSIPTLIEMVIVDPHEDSDSQSVPASSKAGEV